jgi:hypothetical protein
MSHGITTPINVIIQFSKILYNPVLSPDKKFCINNCK